MIYLTLGDSYSGVYASQVIDVCQHLSKVAGKPVRLIAFVAPSIFRKDRQAIKDSYPHAIILPAWPGIQRWRNNFFLLWIIVRWLGDRKVMARGLFATLLAQRLRRQGHIDTVIYDGRGAYKAEWEEYMLIPREGLISQAAALESQAVTQSDFRLAVSHALVHYWKTNFNYSDQAHVVIPCTLNQSFLAAYPTESDREAGRQKRGYSPSDIVLVYAGSMAGWQSIKQLDTILESWLSQSPHVKVLFLAKIQLEELRAYKAYPDRITKDWLPVSHMYSTLSLCDYGLLLREPTVTNQVASPTKFAEYLAAGLKVLISPRIGDFSKLVETDSLGHVIRDNTFPPLVHISHQEKVYLHHYALSKFSKGRYLKAYSKLIQAP